MVFLPGTFTVPQQFSRFLEYASQNGFDAVGLDYAWGPAPDSARNAACNKTGSCQSCQLNYHERVFSGGGQDLISGGYPVFGHHLDETLKFTHFFASGVTFLPEAVLPPLLESPIQGKSSAYIANIGQYAIEPLLIKVLRHLGWTQFFSGSAQQHLRWSDVVIAGHSQGASHASYVAGKKDVKGALLFSGPQDQCGSQGAAGFWPPQQPRIYGCFSKDEPAADVVRSNSATFKSGSVELNTQGKTLGISCAPPDHCATAVDDQLVQESVDRCFSKIRDF